MTNIKKGDRVEVLDPSLIVQTIKDQTKVTHGTVLNVDGDLVTVELKTSRSMKYAKAFFSSVIRLLPILLLFCSCSTVKKLITKSHVVTDSSASRHSDSTATHEFIDNSQYLYLDSSDITIEYGKDTTHAVDTFRSKQVQVLHDVVKAVSGNRVPTKVIIHVGHLVDTTKDTRVENSVVVVKSDTSSLKKTVDTVNKNIQRKRSPLVLTIGAIILMLGLIVFIVYKVYSKISPSSWIVTTIKKII